MSDATAIVTLGVAVFLLVSLNVWFWLRYGDCGVGRHQWSDWGESFDASRMTGWDGKRGQYRSCTKCNAQGRRFF